MTSTTNWEQAEKRLRDAAWVWLNHDETEPVKALAYRELARAVEESGRKLVPRCGKRDGVIAWHSQQRIRWVTLFCYSKKSFRLSTARTWFYYDKPEPRAPHQFELSFAPSEIGQVAKNFVRFTESAFASDGDHEKIWRWPLFHESKRWHVGYAWTRIASDREALTRAFNDWWRVTRSEKGLIQ
jgi:hypothetical protein